MVRQNGLGAPAGDDFAEPAGDFADGFLPRNPAKFTGPFRACAAHRVEQPVAVIHAPVEMRDLAADESGRRGMVFRSANAGDAPFFDSNLQRAGVGTIHRAGCAQRRHGKLKDIFSSPRRRDARANMSHRDSPEETLVNCGKCLSLTTEGWGEVTQEHNQTDKQYKMPYGCESKRANPASNDGLGSEGDCQCQSAPEVCTLGSLLL